MSAHSSGAGHDDVFAKIDEMQHDYKTKDLQHCMAQWMKKNYLRYVIIHFRNTLYNRLINDQPLI